MYNLQNTRKPQIKKCTKKEQIPRGKVLNCLATFIESPSNFYVVQVSSQCDIKFDMIIKVGFYRFH